ncbi:MAG: hypothetical protein ACKODH_17875 [Limisphaerales bacterium]
MSRGIALLAVVVAIAAGLWLAVRPTPVPPAPTPVVTEPTAGATAGLPALAREPARPRLPAPRLPPSPTKPEAPIESATNSLAKFLRGEELPKLTREQLDIFLRQNKRSAESLLAASRAVGDVTLLREAVEKFPNDPRARFDLAMRGETPEERRQALDAFRQLARDNPLGDYLSALDRFKSGQTDEAVKDLLQANSKNRLQDYTLDHMQSAEEAFLSAGYDPLEAKAAGTFGVQLPHLQALRDLANQVLGLQQQYAQVGDAASARAVGQLGMNLAAQLEGQPGRTLISELVGIAIEKKFLSGQAPDSPLGDGRTAGGRLTELDAQRQAIRDATQFDSLLDNLPPQEVLIYFDRLKLNGELDALRWLKNKHGRP